MKAHPPLLLVPTLALSILFAVVDRAEAAVLLNYDFTGASLAPTSTDPNVTASSITATGFGIQSTAVPPVTGTWGGSVSGNDLFVRAEATVSAANFSVDSDYFEFTLSPDTDFELDLVSLTLSFTNSIAIGAPAYTLNLALRSSQDSFAANIPSTPASLTLARTSNGTTTSSGTVDLSGVDFQDLTSLVTFRLYVWDSTDHTNNITRLDNIVINGIVTAVPEPSVPFILGLAALIFPCFRRSRSGVKAA